MQKDKDTASLFENRLVMHLIPILKIKVDIPTDTTIGKHNDRSPHDNHDFEFSRVDVGPEDMDNLIDTIIVMGYL